MLGRAQIETGAQRVGGPNPYGPWVHTTISLSVPTCALLNNLAVMKCKPNLVCGQMVGNGPFIISILL